MGEEEGAAKAVIESKHSWRDRSVAKNAVRSERWRNTISVREKKVRDAEKRTELSTLLLTERAGKIHASEKEDTALLTQKDIASSVDIASAEKYFELHLDKLGPYRIDYTRNGRKFLMGGKYGHVAAFDWMSKKLLFEINVMEVINDVSWLHQETFMAAAQRKWTYVYDNNGIEVHCLKFLDSVLRMEFLPYHFLLAAANEKGYLSYVDISVGQRVAGYSTCKGRLDAMTQNPGNALVCLGHSRGTVSMWSPNLREPVATVLCHPTPVKAVACDPYGRYLVTSGGENQVKVWDVRTLRLLNSLKLQSCASHVSFSQHGDTLAVSCGRVVEVYQDVCASTSPRKMYLRYPTLYPISDVKFCPFEDVLGVGHEKGISSILVPGSGEPNFDGFEANPFQTKSQRRENEVKRLLQKIPHEMISLEHDLFKVDKDAYSKLVEEHNRIAYLKPKNVEFEPRKKTKGKSKSVSLHKRKKLVQEDKRKDEIKKIAKLTNLVKKKIEKKDSKNGSAYNPLDRLKKKT